MLSHTSDIVLVLVVVAALLLLMVVVVLLPKYSVVLQWVDCHYQSIACTFHETDSEWSPAVINRLREVG
jgi:uncharacterized membrane protein